MMIMLIQVESLPTLVGTWLQCRLGPNYSFGQFATILSGTIVTILNGAVATIPSGRASPSHLAADILAADALAADALVPTAQAHAAQALAAQAHAAQAHTANHLQPRQLLRVPPRALLRLALLALCLPLLQLLYPRALVRLDPRALRLLVRLDPQLINWCARACLPAPSVRLAHAARSCPAQPPPAHCKRVAPPCPPPRAAVAICPSPTARAAPSLPAHSHPPLRRFPRSRRLYARPLCALHPWRVRPP